MAMLPFTAHTIVVSLICFLAFFKDSLKYVFSGKILENGPRLGAIHASAKVIQLGAVDVGAKPPYHLADDAELTVTWQPPWRRRHWR
jgi:hypothetical protein